jgi:hypothetical protein
MADEKEPMQADGSNGVGAGVAKEKDPPSDGRPNMDQNPGQSGGGAYPHDEDSGHRADFHGGQSEPGYFGEGQLGSKDVGENSNAVNEED